MADEQTVALLRGIISKKPLTLEEFYCECGKTYYPRFLSLDWILSYLKHMVDHGMVILCAGDALEEIDHTKLKWHELFDRKYKFKVKS